MKKTNFICEETAARIKFIQPCELLTNGICLRRSRALAGIESTEPTPKTKDKTMNRIAEKEAEHTKQILLGNDTGYIIIPVSLAQKIDFPKGKTKNHRALCLMVQCVLLDEPSETQDEIFNRETDEERQQMRNLKKAKDANRQRTAKARHAKRVDKLPAEQKAAFEIIWNRHPLTNRGQERKAVYRYAEAIRKGAKIADIDKGHLRWCNSPNWKTEDGEYAAQLWKWLKDEQWKITPPDRRSKREKDAEKENATASEAHLDLV